MTDIFKFDPDYTKNEEKYREIKTEILGENESSDGSGSEDSDEDSEDEARESWVLVGVVTVLTFDFTAVAEKEGIEDQTGTNLVNLRRTIYLTIMNSVSYASRRCCFI